MSLSKKIDDSRNIKENSLRAYMISLKKIHEKLDTDDSFDSIDKWLVGKNVERVINLLGEMKITTRKNYLAAVIVALTTDKDKYEAPLKEYREYLDIIVEEYNTQMKTQKKSKTQEENWASMDELKEIVSGYKKEIRKLDLANKETWSNKEYNLYQMYLVGLLYTELPPVRLDYSNMLLITETDYKKLKEKDNNYLVLVSRNKKYFSLGSYKTEDKYGVHIIEIPSIINSVINKFLQHNDSGYFLTNTQRNVLSDNGLTKLLNKVFAATGKKISSTMIRHVYLSEKYDARNGEMEKDAAAMLHSVGTQQGTYVKK
tara:strand:+ start:894 stop:1838 length:945 start_codon:yes stop_codon:yes gene_type:complete